MGCCSGSAVATGGETIWRSPIPYLFGGLGLMLTLIATALILLACTHKKRSSLQDVDVEDNKPKLDDMVEPCRLVVIMAGDTNPTFIAIPLSAAPVPPPPPPPPEN